MSKTQARMTKRDNSEVIFLNKRIKKKKFSQHSEVYAVSFMLGLSMVDEKGLALSNPNSSFYKKHQKIVRKYGLLPKNANAYIKEKPEKTYGMTRNFIPSCSCQETKEPITIVDPKGELYYWCSKFEFENGDIKC